ncbi:hypothetical protein B2I21_31810 [Chryseobacterium mucoviscidosis]|nr:hypothetical protein B2I21_31810 [Chryseobacterium mucoviscidosis]
MKLIRILMLFGAILLLMPSYTYAADPDTNLIAGKALSGTGEFSMATQYGFTDGDKTTNVLFGRTAIYSYVFATPAYITELKIYSSQSAQIVAKFYDATNKLIGTFTTTGTDNPRGVPVGLDSVAKVTFNLTVVNNFNVNEIELFGYGSTYNPDTSLFMVNDLTATPYVGSATSVNLNWKAITSPYFAAYELYKDDVYLATLTTNSYSASALIQGKSYSFKVVPFDIFGKSYTGSSITYTVPEPDTTPPGQPTAVTVTPDRYSATVKWTAPLDNDVAGYYLYLDGEKVNSMVIRGTQYNLTGLSIATAYKVYVIAVDTSGNLSPKSAVVDFKTLELSTAPNQPKITGTPYSGGASISWGVVPGATSYKVYQNGVLLKTTDKASLRLDGLVNEQAYTFYVIASNVIGDSAPSNTITITPSIKSVPEVSIGYKLKDVADGTSSWFSSYWLILAFSLSIPLSFYVSNRIKGLFVS